jgi:hypothetical protein
MRNGEQKKERAEQGLDKPHNVNKKEVEEKKKKTFSHHISKESTP